MTLLLLGNERAACPGVQPRHYDGACVGYILGQQPGTPLVTVLSDIISLTWQLQSEEQHG